MRTERVAVLGSGCAGMIAALRIAGRVRRHARAVLIDPKDHFIEQLRLRQIGTGPKLAQPSYKADRFPELCAASDSARRRGRGAAVSTVLA